MIRVYVMLTKPGIIVGNLITTLGGFALAFHLAPSWRPFFAAFIGLALLIASAGVFNNCIDRERDQKMERTQKRALPQGLISVSSALLFGTLLFLLAAAVLALWTPQATLLVSLAGFIAYVLLYSFIKPKSHHGTWVGSLSGAVPPVVGYTAGSGEVDGIAALLFLLLFCWQMPHFFAISLYRLEEYRRAEVPVLPLIKGIEATKVQMLLYTIAFALLAFVLGWVAHLHLPYFVTAGALSLAWLSLTLEESAPLDERGWGKKIFAFSLVAITALFGAIGIDRLLA